MADWYMIVIEGSERDLRAFVSGFLADRGADPARVAFVDDVGLERESLHERLRALLHGGHHALIVPDDLATATFGFAAEVFARDVSTAIRTVVGALPAGVHATQHSEHEEEHAESKGVELYAPAHHYAYRVRGVLTGPVEGALNVRRRLADIEAVRLEPLRLA